MNNGQLNNKGDRQIKPERILELEKNLRKLTPEEVEEVAAFVLVLKIEQDLQP